MRSKFYLCCGKRAFDVTASLIGFVLLFPVFVILFFIVTLSSKGGAFYVQKRVGKNFKEFNLYKFRSMVVDADRNGPSVTSRCDPRITTVGRFLRNTKLDELPQLLNVIKGEMSLVGPRPEVAKFVNIKKEEYKKVLSVRPGITDNAALEYRDEEKILQEHDDKEMTYIELILPHKIELYNKYIDNISFLGDIKLIFKTLNAIK